MPSFDVVSTFNIQEVDNAINITAREITTRYDLKDQQCSIIFNKNDKTSKLDNISNVLKELHNVSVLNGNELDKHNAILDYNNDMVESVDDKMYSNRIKIKKILK